MDRVFVSVLLLASVIGPMTCVQQDKPIVGPPEPPHHSSPKPEPTPNVTTAIPPITTSSTPAPITTKPTPKPTPAPTTSTTTQSPATSTNGTTTSQPPTPTTSKGTTPSPHPPTTPTPPSDRKFEAFSFIGGFALAIGLVAIGFLAWKLYISRRENVYHTL